MQKFINEPKDFVSECLEGIVDAHRGRLRICHGGRGVVRRDAPKTGKVGIVTGGGSGHLPLFLGYVGDGLADGVAVGEVFQSPRPSDIAQVTREVNAGLGVLYLYGNYGGDTLNFGLAEEELSAEGIGIATVLGIDDVASAPEEERECRRGIAGMLLLYKVAGAAAAQGKTLEEVEGVALMASARLRSVGVALSPCVVASTGLPSFDLPEGQMEIGVGIHGEPGVARFPWEPAERVAERVVDLLFREARWTSPGRLGVVVNGLGGTSLEELYVLYRSVARLIRDKGFEIHRTWVGEFATSFEMAGASVSVMLLEQELQELVDAPATSPFYAEQ